MEISKEQNVIIFKLEMIAYNLIKILVVCPVFLDVVLTVVQSCGHNF